PAVVHTALTEEEFAVLSRFVDRRGDLAAERRDALAAQLAARLEPALDEVAGPTPLARLVRLHAQESAARARGAAARGTTGARREKHALIASRSPRWLAFSSQLARAQRQGLRALGEQEVRELVAEYRDLSADLARLRTASGGAPSEELFYLSRLVSGAHNLLYRRRALSLGDVARALFASAPREVRRSWRPVLLAAVALFLPGAIAYTAVATRPALAAVFIPPSMLDRAEDGVRRARSGEGYITDPQILRPVMASSIIANNVQVSFVAFAGGITAGLGTLLVLLLNGVSLGGVFGLYASKGILSLIIAFVAPHGVLELTAICIAGGAGLLLGSAFVVPGPRTRRRALVENGRRAARLIVAATVLLLVAGLLEGFVSPIEWWPLAWKLSVSALTAVALVLYLRGGREARAATPGDAPAAPPVDLLALSAERQMAPRDLSSR
ncbi:MAG TPA: stage II sporulation protein M, partial [Gemmatimonadaceae bacterium]|nr:stage II sporulation protein M [Gemmatimonadaceae bacterium]